MTWVGNGCLREDNYKKLLLHKKPKSNQFKPLRNLIICKNCNGRGITFHWERIENPSLCSASMSKVFSDGHIECGYDISQKCITCKGRGFLGLNSKKGEDI
jgi:DnaJ-class molecular chaperone